MARRCFFSFHYERDVWRASQVRNCWVTREREAAGFWDAADWESVQRNGEAAVKRWIREQMVGTSVTVVLVGAQTAQRDYVRYEIQHSHDTGKGMLGVRVHGLENQWGLTDQWGENPFEYLSTPGLLSSTRFSQLYPVYDWSTDHCYQNIGRWVEEAALRAGR